MDAGWPSLLAKSHKEEYFPLMRIAIRPCLLLCAGLALVVTANARESLMAGPVAADVVRVIDGDTFVADAHIWPGQTIRVSIRIRGIDAPELHSRCRRERAAARRSRKALDAMLAASPVEITNIGGGKYYGRVLADVAAGGRPVAGVLLGRQLARAYHGGRRVRYCG